MAREAVAHAKDDFDKYSKLVVKLEAEKRLAADFALTTPTEPTAS